MMHRANGLHQLPVGDPYAAHMNHSVRPSAMNPHVSLFHGPQGRNSQLPMVDPSARNPLYSPGMASSHPVSGGHSGQLSQQVRPRGGSHSSHERVPELQGSSSDVAAAAPAKNKNKKKGCCGKEATPAKNKNKKKKGCCGKEAKESDNLSHFSVTGSSSENGEFGAKKKKCCCCGPRTPNRKVPSSRFSRGGDAPPPLSGSDVPYAYRPTAEMSPSKKCC